MGAMTGMGMGMGMGSPAPQLPPALLGLVQSKQASMAFSPAQPPPVNPFAAGGMRGQGGPGLGPGMGPGPGAMAMGGGGMMGSPVPTQSGLGLGLGLGLGGGGGGSVTGGKLQPTRGLQYDLPKARDPFSSLGDLAPSGK